MKTEWAGTALEHITDYLANNGCKRSGVNVKSRNTVAHVDYLVLGVVNVSGWHISNNGILYHLKGI